MEKTPVQEKLLAVYDYIVVGAGATGCVVASRLSEDPSKTVLVLEAGGDDRDYPDMALPGKIGNLRSMEYDWGFQTIPREGVFKGYRNQVYNSVCGKVLGGSSAINYMVYMRGTPHDFDIWERMGCAGWGYKDVLPYFMKSECCLVSKHVDSGFHGTNGPMMVTEARFSPLADVFIEGGKTLGYKETDCNADDPIGFMVVQADIGDGIRQSSAEVFLRPASTRPNLHIATNAYVTKVLINNKVARGVEFYRSDVLQSVRARREVVLCAGAYCSPQILMLSGVGPKDHLAEHGIPLVQDLPVGNNLQDHIAVMGLEFEVDKPLTVTGDLLNSQLTRELYEKQRAGPLATGIIETTALIRTKYQVPDNPNPDIQLISISGLLGTGKYGRPKNMATMKDEVFDAMFEGNEGKHGFSVTIINTHPRSRGKVRLANTDPRTLPLIDHNSLTDYHDVSTLVEGIKIVMELIQTKPFRDIGAKFTARVLPGYKGTPFTDEYWEECVRTLTNTYHPSGTCKMGRKDDPSTVVDPQLRVKGINQLRVADASIMPEISSANLNASCIMIGEKAADLIKRSPLPAKL